MSLQTPLAFDNSYARLPERFYARLEPTPVAKPGLIKLNRPLAERLGADTDFLAAADGIAVLAGNKVPDAASPLAMVYAGHQFGGWVPQLGDGRALLLGEIVDRDGLRLDVQLKGSGRTPFSRSGDGRAAVGPILREYIVSEAMAALGVPTTRALAAVTTGEQVFREEPLPGAILTRVARSHVRVGTFQYFASMNDVEGLRDLADYVIQRLHPGAAELDNPYVGLLDRVIAVQASLVARWMGLGFIHGVMNTDNMSIAGETIDYGPCAFMDAHHPGRVYSSIDHAGRYAFANQPGIAYWNLSCLAQSLLSLIDEDEDTAIEMAQIALNRYPEQFQANYLSVMGAKLGLSDVTEEDAPLIDDLLQRMADNQADFTLTFRGLCALERTSSASDAAARDHFVDPTSFDAWAEKWRVRLKSESADDEERQRAMRGVNPMIIPRNHMVEQAIQAAVNKNDFTPFEDLTAALERPFDEAHRGTRFAKPPLESEIVAQTFCGT